MLVVHNGTANINKRNVNNVKCVNCKNCIATVCDEHGAMYYVCEINLEFEYVEECIANDDNMECDLYVQDSNDDTSERA